MDNLKEYLKYSTCSAGIKECFYGDDYTCAECIERMLAEHDAKVRADAIEEFVNTLCKESFSAYVMDIVRYWADKLKEKK